MKPNHSRLNIVLTVLVILFFLGIGYRLFNERGNAPKGKEPLRLSAAAVPTAGQLALFSKRHPDIWLSRLPGGDSLFDLMVQTNAGRGPDLLADLSVHERDTAAAAGMLADLTPLVPEAELARIPENLRRMLYSTVTDKDGRTARILAVWPAAIQNVFILYNRDMFEEHGVAVPSDDLTWDEYRKKAARLRTRPEEEAVGKRRFGAIGVNPVMLIGEKGGDFFTEDGTRCTLDSPEVIAAMEFYHRLIHHDRVESVEAQSGLDNQETRINLFLQRRTAMLWVSRQALTPLRQQLFALRRQQQEWQRNYPDRPFPGPFPFAVGACLVPRFRHGRRWVNGAVSGVSLNRGSKHRKAAAEFIRFLYSPDYLASLSEFPLGVPAQSDFRRPEQLNREEYPEEDIINRIALSAVASSRERRRSIFAPDLFVEREFQKARFRIATDPGLNRDGIAAVMRQLTEKITEKMHRTIAGDATLRLAYERLVAANGKPEQAPQK